MSKYAGHSSTLQWDPAGGTTYVTIGQIIDLAGPGMERNPIDATTRDSSNFWREFLKGFKDGGELTFGVAFDQALATHGSTSGLMGQFNDDSTTKPAFRINRPDGSKTIRFSGLLTGFEPTDPLDELSTADCTIKVSGRPLFN